MSRTFPPTTQPVVLTRSKQVVCYVRGCESYPYRQAVASYIAVFILLLAWGVTASAQHPVLVSQRNNSVLNGSGLSGWSSVSSNGRFVAFESTAFNLVSTKDDNGRSDVFVRDLQTGTTILVSINSTNDRTANGDSNRPVISADGRFVAFQSDASNLVSNDNNSSKDIFVRDLLTNKTTLVSVNSAGTGSGNSASGKPVISADGRFIAFQSSATNLDNRDTNGADDIFVRDLQTETTSLVSINGAGTASGNKASFWTGAGSNTFYRKVISADGRFVVFESAATDLVASPPNGGGVFVRDLQSGTTTLVSINAAGTGNAGGVTPIISANGKVVVFVSTSTNLVTTPSSYQNIFARNLQTGQTVMVSINNTGTSGGNGNSDTPTISDDGRYVAFKSQANDLTANDSGSGQDIFVRDLQMNTTDLVSVRTDGKSGGGDTPAISGDGRFVTFLFFDNPPGAPPVTNPLSGVVVRDLQKKTTTLLSINSAGTGPSNGGGQWPIISSDGRVVVFESSSRDMVPTVTGGSGDVYAFAINGPLRFSAYAYTIGEDGGGAAVTISRAGSNLDPVTINYTTSNGTASSRADYSETSGMLSFAAGETSKTFVVPILEDSTDEFDEAINLVISDFADTSATATLSAATLTIIDNDAPPTLSINDVTVTEGDEAGISAVFTVSVSEASAKEITIDLSTGNGTASSGLDYQFNFSKMIIGPGQSSVSLTVPITGDLIDEFDETFTVTISNPINATIARAQGTATILDNDAPPTISISDVTLSEGNSGTKNATFAILLARQSGKTVAIDYATADGSASSPTDYQSVSGTLTFNPGETFKLLTVLVNGDMLNEANETFTLNLTNPQNVSISRGVGTATITNDDTPTIQLSSSNYTVNEGDSSGTLTLTVNRTGDTSSTASVDFTTSDTSGMTPCQTNTSGNASERCDYATAAGTLRFAAGESSKVITIPIINDSYQEPDETFNISLSNPSGAELGTTSIATVTIRSDDTQAAVQNPIDNQAFFIRQQYIDFLGRVAEPAGFDFWMNRMNNCPEGQICDRIDTSQRFFQSDEFQARGFYVYRLYDALLGRLPKYAEFVPDVARLNGFQTVAEQRQSKDAYLLDFINKTEFRALYGQYLNSTGTAATNPTGFVDALCARAGITPASRQTLIANLQIGARDPAHTVEDFILQPELSNLGTLYYDRGFITMQYFGYLRRDPETAGFNFWVGQLIGPNALHRGDYRFMVGGFLQSDEYCFRFAPISHAP